ncbi:MAG: hypothetical protein ABIQ59_05450 [Nocardioidaceae bacterium]
MAPHSTNSTRRPTRPLRTRIAALLGATSVIMMSGGLVLMTAPAATAGGGGQDKVGVCHRTNSDTNPYVYLEVPAAEANGHLTGTAKDHNGQGRWKTAGTFRGVPHQAGDEKHDYLADSASDCNDSEVPPSDESVTPSYPSATVPTCDTDGHLVVPAQKDGVIVTADGADGAGPGTYHFTYAPDDGFFFPEGTDTSQTVTVLAKTGHCPVETTPVTPLTPTVNPPSCTAAGTLVAPTQPAGVVTSGGGANGAGPGTYAFSFAPDGTHTFPQGVANPTVVSVTVLPQLTGGNCETVVNPTLVAPNAPSTTPPTCAAAGSVVAPAAKTGVAVVRTELSDGSVRFDSTPANGFAFTGAQTVSATVTALARLTGVQCAEVKGTDASTDEPPVTVKTPVVEGTPATRTPVVKGTKAAAAAPTVAGVSASAPVPSAVEAGLAGQQTDARVLVGEALLGGGLLLLVGATWSGLGTRRRGVGQA